MRRRFVWVVSLAALLACGSYLVVANRRGSLRAGVRNLPERTGTAASGFLLRTLRLTGTTSARAFVNIAAPLQEDPESGRDLVLVELATPGSFVKKGALVARLGAQSLRDHAGDLLKTLRQAQAGIAKRQAEQALEWEDLQRTVRAAKADLDQASLALRSAATPPGVERDLLQLSVDEASARYRELLRRSALKKEAALAELRILEISAQRYESHRGRHTRDLAGFTIYAPMDGLAEREAIWRDASMGWIEAGDPVRPGQILMKVVDPRTMRLRAFANQADSLNLRPGQKAVIRLDGVPDLRLAGTVSGVGAAAFSSGWGRSDFLRRVAVDIDIDGQDSRVLPDLSASADVTLAETGPTVIVARGALRSEGSETFVTVRSDGQFSTRRVTVGLADNLRTQILSGLAPGEIVRLN